MTKISRQEVLHIARISALALKEEEVDSMVEQLEQVLSYAERVKEVASTLEEPSTKNINQMRQDFIIPQDPEPLLAQAPEREGNYFVVPMILN